MITKQQLILIHTAKRQIEKLDQSFDDAAYRTVLRSIAHVESSRGLDNKTFEQVMAWFESVGFNHRGQKSEVSSQPEAASPSSDLRPPTSDRYWQGKASRHARYASDRELRMIEQLQTQSPYPLPSMVRRLSSGRTDQATELYVKEAYALINALKKIVERESKRGPAAPAGASAVTQAKLLAAVAIGRQMNRFFGQTYMYPSPNDGDREIGVTNGLGSQWIVGWIKLNGSVKRQNTSNLPAGRDPQELQTKLDAWAAERALRRVIPGGPIQ